MLWFVVATADFCCIATVLLWFYVVLYMHVATACYYSCLYMLLQSKPWPIILKYLPIYSYMVAMLLSNAQNLPIMLNIVPMTTAIKPQFVCI